MKIMVTKQAIAMTRDETLIRNTKSTYPVLFVFDSTWNDFTKTAFFQAGDVLQSVVLANDRCDIPTECLKKAGVILKVLVTGVKDGEEKSTRWCPTSIILYDTVIDIPVIPSVIPAITGEVGRLCNDFADALNGEYVEDDLKHKTLADVITEMEEDYVPTATDEEVDEVLDDVWGPD